MHCYKAYGLTIASELPLDRLLSVPAVADPAVYIGLGEVRATTGNDVDCIVGYAEGLLKFVVEQGRRITIQPEERTSSELLRAVVAGELLAAILRQRGLLVLHASCVARDGKALAFMGQSGWGKSTLAAAFLGSGYRLVCDDLLAVDLSRAQPQAIPSSPRIRLLDDVGHAFKTTLGALPVRDGLAKCELALEDAFEESPVPLLGLYVLEPGYTDCNEIIPLTPTAASLQLVRHTRVTRLLDSHIHLTSHLNQCAQVVSRTRVATLRRVRSLARLTELRHMVEDDCFESLQLST